MIDKPMAHAFPALREVATAAPASQLSFGGATTEALRHTTPNRDRGHRRLRLKTSMGIDLAVIGAVTILALLISIRSNVGLLTDARLYAPVALTVMPLWAAMIWLAGGYRRTQLTTEVAEYRSVFNGSLLTAGLLGVSAYLLEYPLSRTFYGTVFLIGIPAVLVAHIAFRRIIKLARVKGKYRSRVLIAGDLDHIIEVMTILNRETWLGYDPIGVLAEDIKGCQAALTVPVVAVPEYVVDAVRRTEVDTVIFTEGAYPSGRDFNLIARELEHERTDLIVVPSVTDVAAARMNVRPVAGLPLVHIEKPRAAKAGAGPKRVVDIVGAVLLMVATAPLVALAALAIKLEDGGPVIFKQRRVGLGGEVFDCLKLRSMVTDAETIKARALLAHNESDGVLFKMRKDPRITRVGTFIRRYSIDEMPQFVNVLKGEMSLVGPRPALEAEVARYQPQVLRRLDVRPGLTGLWQVSGRSDLSWEDTVRLDLYYVDNWSMLQDVAILGRTAKAVVGSSGAY
ncbi:sugar transferase [Acidipropionibacterium jensenii]|uniref:sugar transferase n=1 Tax=Acidipropionibacterium jensenii TaxID=1749 RepID=UPI000BC350B5|nr:sugar transferase [Acidipropionibacterium jensenii]